MFNQLSQVYHNAAVLSNTCKRFLKREAEYFLQAEIPQKPADYLRCLGR